jgi:hypothetical protein
MPSSQSVGGLVRSRGAQSLAVGVRALPVATVTFGRWSTISSAYPFVVLA